MSMINTSDILETIGMITSENLDVRTVTMGISLLDCADPDPKKACEKIYNKITEKAARLVPVVEKISTDYGIPIINKRISVTPIAMLLASAPHRRSGGVCQCAGPGSQGRGRELHRRLRRAGTQGLFRR